MLFELNPQQRAAVQHINSPLLVLAGAGSGKTGVITKKITWLLNNGFSAEEILAVTFTNKAAREMSERVQAQIKNEKSVLQISTFHRLGMRILYREAGLIGLRSDFSIVSRDDCIAMLGNFAPSLQNYDVKHVAQIVDIFSRWKNHGIFSENVRESLDEESSSMHIQAAEIYADFDEYLIACNSVDLDGLLTLPMRIFKKFPQALAHWQQRCRYLLVDEYQDTNRVQYELIRLLVGDRDGLTVVGDDDQSIYTWRGADSRNIEGLTEDFPNLEVIKLEQNYRCTNTILKAANALIANNPRLFEKKLWCADNEGGPIQVFSASDEQDEAQEIVEAISGRAFVKNLSYSEFAILLRSNFQARFFETALREARIPYSYTGGQSMFERTEIKDVIAYLRFIVNDEDTAAFLRIVNTPRRGIGAATLSQLAKIAQRFNKTLAEVCALAIDVDGIQAAQRMRLGQFHEQMVELRAKSETLSPNDLYDVLLKEIEYNAYLRENSENAMRAKARIDRVLELGRWIKRMAERGKSLAEIVRDFSLVNRDESADDEEGQVNLCTIHSAKGLEFNHVYIAGVEENLIPHRNSIEADTIEEERRLFYVAMTRAKKSLTISYCLSRKAMNERNSVLPSRFLTEIPNELMSQNVADESEMSSEEFVARLDELLESFAEDG